MIKIQINTIDWITSQDKRRYAIIKDDHATKYIFWLGDRKEEDMKKLLDSGASIDAEVSDVDGWQTIIRVKGEEIFGGESMIEPKVELPKPQENTVEEILAITNTIKANENLSEDQLTKYELTLSTLSVDLAVQYAKNYRNFKKRVFDEIEKLKGNPKMSSTAIKAEAEKEAWMEKVAFKSNEVLLSTINGVLLSIKDRIKFLKGRRY